MLLLNPSSNQRNSLGHGALLDGPNPARAELKEQDAPCAHLLRLSPSLPWLKPEQLRMTTECVLVCSAPPGARARHSGNDAWSLALHHDVVCAGGWQRLGDGAGRVLLRLDVSLQAPLCQVQGGRSRVCQVCTSSATGQGRCFSQPAACPPRSLAACAHGRKETVSKCSCALTTKVVQPQLILTVWNSPWILRDENSPWTLRDEVSSLRSACWCRA